MALSDLPSFSPSKETLFLIGAPILIFIFFFTQIKESDTPKI
ncbi:hypothetical protein [Jeotgalibacillus soli]|uniref:Uncharacterized protein n=1 Tax=Jeotgalibacillus soli TaxID=889306 RepID=A0A0C2RTZ6_9BACL|nr:hypothetical protein [Jeotgalibacillus soli]KIL45224.1 hypothetical protein KP78_27680 [Jeotgalibacillus soli]